MDADGRKLDLAKDRSRWRQELNHNLRRGEKELQLASDELSVRRKKSQQAPPTDTTFQCSHCGRDQ